MDMALGFLVLAVLLGFGTRQWRHAVRERLAEHREDRALRKKYDL